MCDIASFRANSEVFQKCFKKDIGIIDYPNFCLNYEENSRNIYIDYNFSFNKNFQKIRFEDMKIFNLIKNENYYANVEINFQNLLRKKIINKSKIIKELSISRMTLIRILSKKYYWINIETLFNLCKILNIEQEDAIKKIIKIKTKNSFAFNFRNFRISKSLMRIMGHLLGDGGIHIVEKEKKYRAFYVNNEKTLLDDFYSDVVRLFGNVKIYQRVRKNHGDEVWLPSGLGYIFYNILEYKENSKEKRIPKFVFELESKLVCSLLQALYDDEGYLYPQKNMIVISQKSMDLLRDIRNLLIKVGIIPNKILIHNSRTKMYYFSITSRKNILEFYEKIGFKHPTKKKKLEILRNKYVM